MTVGQAGKLFGISAPKLDVETRLVITGEGQRVHVPVCTKEHRFPVVFGVDHEHDAEVALALDRVEHLMREHDSVIFGLHFFQPREVVPVSLAVRGCGTAGP